MKIIILTVAFFGAVAFGASAGEFQLPEGVQTCVEDDPKLSECIKAAIQDQIPKLHKGNSALGIPAIDPFVIENVRFDYSNGVVQGSLALRGVKIYGISRATIQDLDTTLLEDGLTSVIKIHFPRVYVEGTYKADIKFNDVKMNPRGFFNLTMNDITITHKMSGEFNYIDDVKYLKLNSWDIVPIIKNIRFYASDMLPDPQLNAIILDFINQYWPELYKVLLPETRDTWEPVLIENANKFLQTVPFHTLIRKSEN